MTFRATSCFASLLTVLSSACVGQIVANNVLPDSYTVGPSSSSVAVSSPQTAPPNPSWEPMLDRWIDLRELDFSLRYRSVFDSNNAHEDSQGQERSIVDGKFKLDAQGKYGLIVHASTGKYFNWAYADLIGGGNEHALDTERALLGSRPDCVE